MSNEPPPYQSVPGGFPGQSGFLADRRGSSG